MNAINVDVKRPASGRGKRNPRLPVAPLDGEALRRLRNNNDWNQEKLSELSGVSVQTISRLERKPHVADTSTLVALANALGVPVGALLGEEPADLKAYSLPPDDQKLLTELLDRLSRFEGRMPQFLSAFIRSLEGDPDKIVGALGTIENEEEILGLWSSILHAYEDTDWDRMIPMCDKLTEVARRVGRPYLEAVAHAYAAKALRNTGKQESMKEARSRVRMALEKAKSPMLERLAGKIEDRDRNLDKALKCYEESLELSELHPRDDMLYALERVKLLRNLADLHVKIARSPESRRPGVKDGHLEAAEKYLEKAEKAIKTLKTHSESTAKTEEGMLCFSQARLLEAKGQIEAALAKARQSFSQAVVENRPYSYAKTLMFFIHACAKSKQPGAFEQACALYSLLLPLKPHLSLRLMTYYEEWVREHEKTITPHIMELPKEITTTFNPPRELLDLAKLF